MLEPGTDAPVIQVANSFAEVDPAAWNALIRGDFPFARHEFLLSLELGGAFGQRTGCHPRPLLLKRGARIEGALITFLKTNSYGEYIFDWAWANAAQHSGIKYYPKLAALVPFVPATGRKFLIHPEADPVRTRELLIQGAEALAERLGVGSTHYLFTTEEENAQLGSHGLLTRASFQYHWKNRDWKTFEDFLSAMKSKRRSEIRRERAAVARLPLKLRALTGASDLTPERAAETYEFYSSTVAKMGGFPYLTAEVFARLFAEMPDQILLFMAFNEADEPVAAALNFFEGRTLFGRHWGCREEYKNLHFELCYYQAIEWAITHGFELFEAGAQGEHKFARGFLPSFTHSAHRIEHEGLRAAIEDFVEQEREGLGDLFADYDAHNPFKKENEP